MHLQTCIMKNSSHQEKLVYGIIECMRKSNPLDWIWFSQINSAKECYGAMSPKQIFSLLIYGSVAVIYFKVLLCNSFFVDSREVLK